ncbi:MAG: HIT family protein [Robiginitomaculum sp.]
MSIDGAYDSDNIFAKILRGDMPCVKVFEDENTLALMDVFPQSPGHVLVIPKAASRNMLDTDSETLSHVISATQHVAKAVNKALCPDGIVVTQFNGAPAGQTVFHLHFHIIPRYMGRIISDHSSGRMAEISDLETLAAKIRATFALHNDERSV